MDSAQDVPSQEQDALAGDVMESVGMPEESGSDENQNQESKGQESNDPLYVQKRLKQQKRAHERELREMQARMAQMQSMIQGQQEPQDHQGNDPYGDSSNPADEQIRRAVSYALQHKEMEERKAKQAQEAAHVQKQYQDLNKHLDEISDKYDDFDEVVRGEAPFTTAMRDASLLLPKRGAGSAGEVLYKLGKNPEELTRISKLPAIDQAVEIIRLSHALISGGENTKPSQPMRTMGQVKNTPVANSHVVNEKTPIGSIRQRMKSGTWK